MDNDQILEKDHKHRDILAAPWLKMENGRPNLKAILREEVNGAVGRMSVSGMSSLRLVSLARHLSRLSILSHS
jgi:ferric-chelate reductase